MRSGTQILSDHRADIARVAARVARDFETLQVPMLAALVRTPLDKPPGDCAGHAEHAARCLEQLGFVLERHVVPAAKVAAAGMISATNLIVRRRFGDGGGPTIALNAHGDVVPPGEGWTRDPYGAEIIDGTMYGRGVAVSKSDFTTYAFALRALEECTGPLRGTVELHLTYDEETGGGVGPEWLLAQGLTLPDIVISAGFTYFVVVAHAGCLHLDVEVTGRSAHAAMPETGADALEAATGVLAALYQERRSYGATVSAIEGIGRPNMVIGTIRGGSAANVVPGRVTFRLDRRMVPEENAQVVEARLREVIVAAAATFPGCAAVVQRVLLAEPLRSSPAQAPVLTALQRHAERVLGEAIPAIGFPLFTDARLYAAAGCAAVHYGACPRTLIEANGHRADERLALEDLRRATDVVAGTLIELLGCGATT